MTNRLYFRNEQEPSASRSRNLGKPTEPQQFEPSLSHQPVVEAPLPPPFWNLPSTSTVYIN